MNELRVTRLGDAGYTTVLRTGGLGEYARSSRGRAIAMGYDDLK